MKKLLYNINGGALVIVLGIMLMLTIAAIMAVHTSQTDIDLSFNQVDHDHAFYVADAGLKKAFNELNADNFWEAGYADETFEDGTYWVIVERDIPVADSTFNPIDDTVFLRSTALYREAEANVRAIVVPELFFPFKYALFGDDFIFMDNTCLTDSYNSDSASYVDSLAGTEGDIASNGTIDLENQVDINGDATSSLAGGITVCGMCTVTEDINDGADPIVMDPIPDSLFDRFEIYNDNATGMSGDYTLSPHPNLSINVNDTCVLSSGTYYFNDVTLNSQSCLMLDSNDVPLHVTIYMEGNLTLEQSTSVNPFEPSSALLIVCGGSTVDIGNDTEIHAAFYGPEADVTLGQSCEWFGSLIAQSVTMINTGSLHYDEALLPLPVSTTGNMLMIAWEEE